MKRKLLPILILSFFIVGCSQFSKYRDKPKLVSASINGSFRLVDISERDANDAKGGDKLLKAAGDKKMLQQGMLISFFKDGTFTEMSGAGGYKTGKWRYTEKEQVLYLESSSKVDTFYIDHDISNKRQTLRLINHSTEIEMKFIQSAPALAAFEEDPFYFSNNEWRIRPSQQESPGQIEERLGNYFKHLAYLLKAARERKSEVVSFEFSQGIAKIYSGGIGIEPVNAVSKTWRNIFFSDDDASIAYNMFSRYLEKASYKGASTGVWVDDDYNILLSIYGDIKEGKFQN